MKTAVNGSAETPAKTHNRGDDFPTGLYVDADGDLFLAGNEVGDEAYFRIYNHCVTAPVNAAYLSWPLTAVHAGFSVTFTQE